MRCFLFVDPGRTREYSGSIAGQGDRPSAAGPNVLAWIYLAGDPWALNEAGSRWVPMAAYRLVRAYARDGGWAPDCGGPGVLRPVRILACQNCA